MNNGRRRSWVAVAVALCPLTSASGAGAETTVGETFSPIGGCADLTVLQSRSPGDRYTVPFDGVITAWSFQATASPPPTLKLKVGRPDPGTPDFFEIVGSSEAKAPPASQLTTYTDIAIPVRAGDVIGAYYASGPGPPDCARMAPPTYEYHSAPGDQPPGSKLTYLQSTNVQLEIAASLEPDCDFDGLGDETQDPSLAQCHLRTVTLDASRNKVKKGRRVQLSGRVVETRQGGACAANQSVTLQRKRPAQSTFATVEQLQTDTAGAFSASRKVKKTFEYRAQLPETFNCAGQTSNTEKVKVRKPK